MFVMAFSTWIHNKFIEWEKSNGGRRSYVDFSRWLGVQQVTFIRWKNGDSKPNDFDTINLLASKLGDEVYDELGLMRPDNPAYPFPSLSHEIRDRLVAAMSEINDRAAAHRRSSPVDHWKLGSS